MTDLNTREKIIESSKELFAKKGFKGTSIRDIAKKAEVNIGAINYHFNSKETLYCYIFQLNYKWVESFIATLSQDKNLNLKEFSWRVFEFFIDNKSALLNTFKIIIDEEVELSELAFSDEEPEIGPPGSMAMRQKIISEIGVLDDDEIDWAVRVIFSNLIHWAIVKNSPFLNKRCAKDKFLKIEEQKKSIYKLVESTVNYLKLNQ